MPRFGGEMGDEVPSDEGRTLPRWTPQKQTPGSPGRGSPAWQSLTSAVDRAAATRISTSCTPIARYARSPDEGIRYLAPCSQRAFHAGLAQSGVRLAGDELTHVPNQRARHGQITNQRAHGGALQRSFAPCGAAASALCAPAATTTTRRRWVRLVAALRIRGVQRVPCLQWSFALWRQATMRAELQGLKWLSLGLCWGSLRQVQNRRLQRMLAQWRAVARQMALSALLAGPAGRRRHGARWRGLTDQLAVFIVWAGAVHRAKALCDAVAVPSPCQAALLLCAFSAWATDAVMQACARGYACAPTPSF